MSACGLNVKPASCGAFLCPDGAACWRVWAPHHKSVQLVLFDTDGQATDVEMDPEHGGTFFYELQGVSEGQQYGYRLPHGHVRPDPASRWQPKGVHRPSAVLNTAGFQWNDDIWMGVLRERLAIYELHVGTFTREGTFDAAIPRLPELRDLGVTAIEVMPIGQFPGPRDWGYDGVHPYASQNSYGGPHGFARLVNACHADGLAVILDVVYNHLGPEGNYFGEFGPYFTSKYSTPWGAAVNFDGPGSEGVRAFVLENVRYWIRDFHVDGLRLDAIQAMFDSISPHILEEIMDAAANEANARRWPVHIIAESDENDAQLLDPPELKGRGLHAIWNDDFHHSVHSLLTRERQGYYADYGSVEHVVKALNRTFVYDGVYSEQRKMNRGTPVVHLPGDRFVVSIQNHDQVGNRALGDRFGTLLAPEQQRLAAGMLLLSPHLPLLFMGEEYGETNPFPFFCSFTTPELIAAVRKGRRAEFAALAWHDEVPDPQDVATFRSAKLSWSWSDDPHRAGLRQLYRDLLQARELWPPLADFKNRTADLLGGNVLRFVRGAASDDGATAVAVYMNLDNDARPLHDRAGTGWKLLMSSEDACYGGRRTSDDPAEMLFPFEFQVYGGNWETT